ncbi:hypothetical protein [Erysipelothrix tonsillarum]|uniref:hypothetical protein n=1 Tax=Erysipelothrix tonsillarum TaxID=38402 RepID=UPI00036564BD|nr:hypothetical protein [Erysipelothrix tonsillarum]
MEKKKRNIIIVSVVIVALAMGLIYGFMSSKERAAKNIAKSFYENFYYTQITMGQDEDDINKLMKEISKKGISVSLEAVSNVNEIDVQSDLDKLKGCKLDNSFIKITPNDPYAINDYAIETNLDCK